MQFLQKTIDFTTGMIFPPHFDLENENLKEPS